MNLLSQEYQYRPFLTPLPLWDHWFWLLLPLCVGVAIVYKTTKCSAMSHVPREATLIAVYILVAMVGAAAVLGVVVQSR